MTTEEVQQFLDEPRRLVRIGTVDGSGAPHVVPTWFIVRDGTFLVTPRERSAWLSHLRADPRVCFTVDEERSLQRKVGLRGRVQVVPGPGEAGARRAGARGLA